MERGWREMSPNCPRCGSTNTKFCYYNNYSLTQPRYFCKGCRRYWTKGGSLRNVPVGGGCRKSRRGNKLALRSVNSDPTTTPCPSMAPNPCRRSISAFGHVIMNSSVGPSSSTSSSASTIDLAVVYANFLKPKTPQERNAGHHINLPIYHNQMPSPQAKSIDPALASELTDREYLDEQVNNFLLLHHHNHSKQQDQGHVMIPNPSSSTSGHDNGGQLKELLPPFPGHEKAAISWEKSNNHDHHLINIASSNDPNVESNAIEDPLEADTQFSSLFNIENCWSPLDFSGYSEVQTPVEVATTSPVAAIDDMRQQQWP